MDDAVQEYLDFVVRIKGAEMDRWIDEAEKRLTAFNTKVTTEINKTSAAFDRLDKRGVALHTSLTTSLTGVEKLLSDLNAKLAQDKAAQTFMQTIVELGQASRYTATGLDKMAGSFKTVDEAVPKHLGKLAEEAKKATDGVKKVGDETKKTTTEVKKGLAEQKKSAEENAKAAEKMGKTWTANLSDMADGVKEATAAGVVAFAALGSAAGLSLKAFGDLEAGANTLEALGVKGRELDVLTDKAMQFGKAGEAMAGEVQKAEIELSRLGFTGAEVASSIDAIVYASQASNESLAETGETVAGLIKGFGLQAADAAHVADVLAESGNRSALSLGTIQLSMKYIAPVANASNQSLEAMSSILMELSNNMIMGEQAGTSVRSMLDSLNNPGADAAKVLEHLKVKVQDAHGNLKPLADIFGELKVKLADYTTTAKNKMLSDLFGRDAMSAAAVLIKANTQALKENEDALKTVDGASKKAADTMRQGLNAEFEKLKAKTNAAMIEIGEKLAPAVEKAVKFLNKMLEVCQALPEPVKNTAVEVGALALAFTGLSLALGGSLLAGSKLLGMLKGIADLGKNAPWLMKLVELGGGASLGGIGAAVMTGGGIGTLLNFGLNTVAGVTDNQTDRQDRLNDAAAQDADPLKRLARVMGQTNGGANLGQLQPDQLKQTLSDIKALRGQLKSELKENEEELAELEALRAKLNRRQDQLTEFGDDRANRAQEERDRIRLRALEASVGHLVSSNNKLKEYNALEAQFQSELDKRPDQKPGTQTGPEDEAKTRERERAQVKQVDGFVEQQRRATQNLETELARRLAAIKTTDQQLTQGNDQLAEKMVANARTVQAEAGMCYWGVKQIIEKTMGAWSKASRWMPGGSAYEAANLLANDKRFKEVEFDKQNPNASLQSGDIIVYDRGAYFSERTKKHGHVEVVDKEKGVARFGQARSLTFSPHNAQHMRVFRSATSAGGAGSTDTRRAQQEQENLNVLAAHYNQQLQEALAFRNQFPAQSEAWKKADEQVFAIQQEAQAANINMTKVANDLAEKQREAARRWALEQLDLEASLAEAKAQLTEDNLDDIEAAYKRHLTNIRTAELERMAADGITEEEKSRNKEVFDAKRLAAEKSYNDQVRAYNKERAQYLRGLEEQLEDSRINLMADGLDKRLALLDIEKERRLKDLREQEEEERRRWASSTEGQTVRGQIEANTWALNWLGVTDQAQAGYNQTAGDEAWLKSQSGKYFDDLKKQAETENKIRGERLVRLEEYRRNLEAISDKVADAELVMQAALQGQTDPAIIERIKVDGLKRRMELQEAHTVELERQLKIEKEKAAESGAVAEDAVDVERLTREVEASKREQTRMELQMRDLALERLNKERQIREEIVQQMSQSMEGAGQWLSILQKGVGLFKDDKGQPLDLLKMLSVDGKGGIDSTLLNNLLNPKPVVTGRTEAGDHGNPEPRTEGVDAPSLTMAEISGVMTVATEAKKVIDQFGKDAAAWIGDFLVNIPKAVEQETAALNARTVQADLAVRRLRLENRRATVKDLAVLAAEEAKIIQDSTAEQIRELERQARIEEEQLIIRYKGHPEAAKQITALWTNVQAERVRITQQGLSEIERLEREHAQRLLDLQNQVADKLNALQGENAVGAAALTPGKTDDIEAERQRRYQAAQTEYNDAVKLAKAQFDAAGITTIKPEDHPLAQAAKTRMMQERVQADTDAYNKTLAEQQRVKGEIATTDELNAKANMKGLTQELELIRIKSALEQSALEIKLMDLTLSKEERDTLTERLRLLKELQGQAVQDAKDKNGSATRQAGFDRQAEDALGTKTKLDDRLVAYHRALDQVNEEERLAKENLEGQLLTDTLAKLAQRRVNLERDAAKEVKEIWASEYKERLEQQKTLIEEGLELESRRYEDLARIEQAKLRSAQLALQALERDLEAKRKEREAALKPWTVDDGVQNPLWKQKLAEFDPSTLAWEGVDEISNVARRDGLASVSGEAQRKGMLEMAELMELEANAAFRDEMINKQTYAEQMQKAQLLRAKAAQAELATEGLKTRRKLELRMEEAEAYQKFQEMERLAIEAKADLEEQVITDKMALQQKEAAAAQKNLDDHNKALEDLRLAAEEKIRPIDDELKRVDKSTRDWAAQWTNVTSGISAARAEAEQLLAIAQRLPTNLGSGSGGSSGGGSGSGQTTPPVVSDSKPYNPYGPPPSSGTVTPGYNPYGSAPKLAKGGIVPPGYDGDKYGPVWLNSLEPVIPLDRFHDVLRPWLPPPVSQQQPSMVYAPNIDLRGSHIQGEIDLRGIIQSELSQQWRQNFMHTSQQRFL